MVGKATENKYKTVINQYINDYKNYQVCFRKDRSISKLCSIIYIDKFVEELQVKICNILLAINIPYFVE